MKEELINQFITRNGFTAERAEELANLNIELVERMREAVVKFYFEKKDGTVRLAYGTLKPDMLPEVQSNGDRKPNPNVQLFWDTEADHWKSFVKANLIKIA